MDLVFFTVLRRFPFRHRGTPNHHPFLGFFPKKNHPAIGTPPWLWKPLYVFWGWGAPEVQLEWAGFGSTSGPSATAGTLRVHNMSPFFPILWEYLGKSCLSVAGPHVAGTVWPTLLDACGWCCLQQKLEVPIKQQECIWNQGATKKKRWPPKFNLFARPPFPFCGPFQKTQRLVAEVPMTLLW